MKFKLKNTLIITLMLFLTTALVPRVSAKALSTNELNKKTKTYSQTINEYEKIKQLKSLTDEELKKINYSQKDIDQLRNLDFKSEIRKKAQLSAAELKLKGYSDQQINAIKNFDGSEAMAMAASAYAAIYSNLNMADSQYFSVGFSWGWVGQPYFQFTDVISVAWGAINASGSTTSAAINKNSGSVYCNGNWSTGGTFYASYNILDEYGGISFYIPMNDGIGSYIKSGSGRVIVNSTYGDIQEICMRFGYGHTSTSAKPSVGVSSKGISVSVGYSSNCTEEDYSTHRYDRYGRTLS